MALLEKVAGGEGHSSPPTAQELNLLPSNVAAALPDTATGRAPQENGLRESTLLGYISQRWTRACMYRRPWEQQWISSHRNYRGLMGPDLAFTSTEKSKIFIRVTKTKVTAAVGQLIDVLFSNNEFPITIEPQRLPEGVVDVENIETKKDTSQPSKPEQPELKYGYPGDGTRPNEKVSKIAEEAFIGEVRDNETVQPGAAISPTATTIEPALLSAKKMQKKIQDQLRESSGDKHLRHMVFEMVNLGTGCLKGPITVNDVTTEIDEQGQEQLKVTKKPKVEAVSIWNIYTDPDARSVEDCDYIIQRHKLSATQLRGLKTRPYFRDTEIDSLLAGGFNYARQWWEPMLSDFPMSQPIEKFEVLEYWGMVDTELLNTFGITKDKLPIELRDADEIPCNIWVSGNNILRFMINPLNDGRWPFYIVPYEVQPYTIWGIGVTEAMSDSQTLMNGFMRLAVDNAVLSGNLVFEVDETQLVPGQDFSMYPGKFWRKMGGGTGQAIYAHEFPNTAAANIALYDKARELADEATFPSFTHGNTGVNPSLGRTSSGISMMMGAASINVRMALSNINDYMLRPVGQAMFKFNLLTTDDPELKGNFTVNSSGVDGLMRDEIKSQRLLSLIQLAEQPTIAPYMNIQYLIREAVRSISLDPEKCTRTEADAMRYMSYIAQTQAAAAATGGQQPNQSTQGKPAAAENQQTPAAANPNAGQVATAGEQGFSSAKTNNPSRTNSGVS